MPGSNEAEKFDLINPEIRVVMKYYGKCDCSSTEVTVEFERDFGSLEPRECDCSYCRSLSSRAALVSDPELRIEITTGIDNLEQETNGSGQATFFHCKSCGQLIVVGAKLSENWRGAVNCFLFNSCVSFKDAVAIQPRLLSPDEKVKRWSAIWGSLRRC